MQIINPYLWLTRWLVIPFLFMIFPLAASSSQLIYTIQTGSFTRVATAQKQFDELIQKISAEDLEFLRIEKIGSYYSLRVGKFKERAGSEEVYKKIKAEMPDAIIMDAYIKDKRIVRLYTVPSGGDKQAKFDESALDIRKDKIAAEVAEAEGHKKIKPNNERMGDMYAKDGLYLLAIDEYQEAVYKRPILRRKLAALLYDMGFVNEAIAEMEKVVEASPDTYTFRMQLGTFYLAKDRPEKAKEQFMAAVEINPGVADAYCYLGTLFYREKEYDKAWMAVKTARNLGYKGQGLIKQLSLVSKEPAGSSELNSVSSVGPQ